MNIINLLSLGKKVEGVEYFNVQLVRWRWWICSFDLNLFFWRNGRLGWMAFPIYEGDSVSWVFHRIRCRTTCYFDSNDYNQKYKKLHTCTNLQYYNNVRWRSIGRASFVSANIILLLHATFLLCHHCLPCQISLHHQIAQVKECPLNTHITCCSISRKWTFPISQLKHRSTTS